jgi:hypothetical protein
VFEVEMVGIEAVVDEYFVEVFYKLFLGVKNFGVIQSYP